MADAISVSGPISGTDRSISFEAGKLAQLADGAWSPASRHHPPGHGDSRTLSARGTDFFPLTVDIEERAYAAGNPRVVLPS